MKKIAFFIPNLCDAGAENALKLVINRLVEKKPNYDIDLCLGSNRGNLIKDIDSRINILHFNRLKLRYCFFDVVIYFLRNKPEYFISILDYTNIIASCAHLLSLSKSKLILWEHSVTSIHAKTTISKIYFIRYNIIKYFYNRADSIVVASKGICIDLVNNFNISKKLINIINSPVDVKAIIALSRKENKYYKNHERYIVSIGRLVKSKNFDLLINAFKIISSETKYKLLIVGEGPEKENLKQKIKKLHLKQNIKLLEYIKNPYPVLKDAELYAMSSSWEGFGLALIEALALNKNIVSTDCKCGPSEILDNGKYGVLVSSNNEIEFANSLLKVINGEIKFDENKLVERADKYDIDNIIIGFIKLLS